jgi:hypothetical protein
MLSRQIAEVGQAYIRNSFGKSNDPGKPPLSRLGILPRQLRGSPLFALEGVVVALLEKQSQATVSTIEDVIDHPCFDRPDGSWHSGRFADGPLTVNISDVPFSLPSDVPFSLPATPGSSRGTVTSLPRCRSDSSSYPGHPLVSPRAHSASSPSQAERFLVSSSTSHRRISSARMGRNRLASAGV